VVSAAANNAVNAATAIITEPIDFINSFMITLYLRRCGMV
jgi:hypothetical protein